MKYSRAEALALAAHELLKQSVVEHFREMSPHERRSAVRELRAEYPDDFAWAQANPLPMKERAE